MFLIASEFEKRQPTAVSVTVSRYSGMFRKLVVAASLFVVSAIAQASDVYQLSNTQQAFTQTPDMLGGGALLTNKPYGFYMGRLFDTMHIAATDLVVHSGTDQFLFGIPTMPNGAVSARGGSCMWLGTSNGAPQKQGWLTRVGTSSTNCPSIRESQIEPQSGIGYGFNCGEHQAVGPSIARITTSAGFWYNVTWRNTFTSNGTPIAAAGGDGVDPAAVLPPNTVVGYRYTAHGGQYAVVFAQNLGWGFVPASAVTPIAGSYTTSWQIQSYGANAQQVACGGAAPTHGTVGCIMQPGDVLGYSQSLASCGGSFRLDMQTDGNLVEYDSANNVYFVAPNTFGRPGDRLVMQTDGNLVAYDSANTPLWSTGTWGHPGAFFALQSDGNMVVYSPSWAPLWHRF